MNEKKTSWRVMALLTAFGLVLAACNAPASQTTTPSQAGKEATVSARALAVITQVRQDLAEYLGLGVDEVSVVELIAVEWPDASIGCPEPDQAYDQVITPGYEITMQAHSETYAYHTGTESFVRCDDGGPSPTSPLRRDTPQPEEATALTILLRLAIEDLSARLAIPEHTISVESIQAVEWNDSSLGCPKPGTSYLTVITPGYLVLLMAGDQLYEYHTDTERVVYCEEPVGEGASEVEVLAEVRSDLANRLGIPAEEIVVVAIKPVEWPDTSLGCPQPGMFYEQAISPGYQVVLMALEQEYTYHTGPGGFVLCREPANAGPVQREKPTEVPRLDPEIEKLVDEAKEDLSERLGVPIERVHLKSVDAVQWRDSSLGCPEPGMAYLTVITPGYLILLEVDAEIYEYHGDTVHAIYCEDPQQPLQDQ